MKKVSLISFYSLAFLQFFAMFPEYFFSVSFLYVLLVVIIVLYNIYGLILQRALSETLAFVLLMTSYLIFNDDLLVLNFLNFNNSIINDQFAFFTRILICIFSAFYFLIIANCLKEQKIVSFEYLLIILFAVLGLLLVCNSNDFLITYLAIELATLAFYILASFQKTSNCSADTAVKYFIIGAVSSAFFLLGSSFIYGFTGSINFSEFSVLFSNKFDWTYDNYCEKDYKEKEGLVLNFLRENPCEFLLEDLGFSFASSQNHLNAMFSFRPLLIAMFFLLSKNNGEIDDKIVDFFLRKYTYNLKESISFDVGFFDNSFIEFGLVLILFSLFIKLASAPFHIWSLDVYEGVSVSSAFFFAVLTKLSIFVLLIRLCYSSFLTLKSCWQFYSLAVGFFSIFVGSFGGLKEKRLKTLLAYSSISHMGYALIAFSTSTFIGIQMLLFYLFIYMLSGLSIWYVVILLVLKKPRVDNKYSKELSDLVLLRKSNLMLATALSLSTFSIAGIPPLVGFFAKLNVFLAVIGDFFYFIGFLSIICSVVSTFYYIRIVKVLYFENLLVGKLYFPIKTIKTIILSVLVFSLLFFFVNPTILYLVNYKSVLSLL